MYSVYYERGKAGGNKPQIFHLLCHMLAFLSHGCHKPQPFGLHTTTFKSPAIIAFLKEELSAFKLQFQKFSRNTRNMTPLRNFRCLLKINISCVWFINCFLFYEEDFTSLWAPSQIVCGSRKNKKR